MSLEKKVYSERSEIDLCTMLVMMFDYSVENLYPDLLAFLEENWGEDSKHTIWEGFSYLKNLILEFNYIESKKQQILLEDTEIFNLYFGQLLFVLLLYLNSHYQQGFTQILKSNFQEKKYIKYIINLIELVESIKALYYSNTITQSEYQEMLPDLANEDINNILFILFQFLKVNSDEFLNYTGLQWSDRAIALFNQ